MNQQNTNLLTVILVLHNTSNDKLERCLQSLSNQTFKYFILYIVNNASDNNIIIENLKLINEYKKELNIIYENTDNILNNDSANFVIIDNIKTKYACICNPEYIQLPTRLEKQYITIVNGKYDLLYGNISINNKNVFNNKSTILNIDNFAYNNIFTFDTLMFNVKYVKSEHNTYSFDNLYNNIHALLFNYILLYKSKYMNINNSISIYYDSEPVIETNDDTLYITFDKLSEYKKIGINKIYNNQIFYNDTNTNLSNNSKLTCIILCDNKFIKQNNELCKTLFNIRFMSSNIKIIVSSYQMKNIMLSKLYYMFDISYISNDNFSDAFNNALNMSDSENIIVISKSVRFYNKFDEYINIELSSQQYQNTIIQPDLKDIDAFWSYQFELDNNCRTGNKFILFNEKLTEKYNYNEDKKCMHINIPILDDDFIFIAKRSTLLNLYGLYGMTYPVLSNVFLSVKAYLNNINIIIDKNIICKIINSTHIEDIELDNEELEEKNYNEQLKYINSFLTIIYLLFNESFVIYLNILHNIFNDDKKLSEIAKNIVSNEDLNKIKSKLIFKNNINYFYNCMYNFNNKNN